MTPSISVVIPVRNGGTDLVACLEAIRASETAPDELVVVDDGSTDDSRATAERFGARVFSTGGKGPAAARNLGAQQATGDVLFFVDADVTVHPDSIGRVRETFRADAELAGVIGAYDETPHCGEYLSQYKNLQHCFVHRQGKRKAGTFWTGCGAMRREVFLAHGGFDAVTYPRPCIEDIELGVRVIKGGGAIALDPEIQVRHRKRWTFRGLVKTDIFDRAVPWTELILREREMPKDLNLGAGQRVSALLTLLFAALALGLPGRAGWMAMYQALLMPLWHGYHRERNKAALAVMVGWSAAAAGLAYWTGYPVAAGVIAASPLLTLLPAWGAAIEAGAGLYVVSGDGSLALAPAAVWAVLVWLNRDFYAFLARRHGWVFAAGAIPVHQLYFLYSVAGFALGTLRHLTGYKRRAT